MPQNDENFLRDVGIKPSPIRKLPQRRRATRSTTPEIERAIHEQRKHIIPRMSCFQGVQDDRMKLRFAVVLDCEAMPSVGDAVVTRWYDDGSPCWEQVDVVTAISSEAGIELEAFYGGDGSFASTVTIDMLLERSVLYEGVILECRRGTLPRATA